MTFLRDGPVTFIPQCASQKTLFSQWFSKDPPPDPMALTGEEGVIVFWPALKTMIFAMILKVFRKRWMTFLRDGPGTSIPQCASQKTLFSQWFSKDPPPDPMALTGEGGVIVSWPAPKTLVFATVFKAFPITLDAILSAQPEMLVFQRFYALFLFAHIWRSRSYKPNAFSCYMRIYIYIYIYIYKT